MVAVIETARIVNTGAAPDGRLYPDHDQDGARGNRPGGEVLFPALAAPHGGDLDVDRMLEPIGDIAQAGMPL
jgi:hypothetical protein